MIRWIQELDPIEKPAGADAVNADLLSHHASVKLQTTDLHGLLRLVALRGPWPGRRPCQAARIAGAFASQIHRPANPSPKHLSAGL